MEEIKKFHKQIRWSMAIIAALFLISIFFGYWSAIKDSETVRRIIDQMLSQFAQIKDFNAISLFLFIFLNNSIKGFFVIVLGTLFGIAPLLFIFLNGELIGLVLGIAYVDGFGVGRILLGIAPHGIFEIPAIILAAGYGLWLGYRFYRFMRFKDDFKLYFIYALKKYFRLILPLLFVAAFIEAFITPYVLAVTK